MDDAAYDDEVELILGMNGAQALYDNDAFDIAMRYFDLPAGEEECADVESFAGQAIIDTIAS
jgi:hypothetical protein